MVAARTQTTNSTRGAAISVFAQQQKQQPEQQMLCSREQDREL
jgi:hypothetical protein